jgi:hypothetical protein
MEGKKMADLNDLSRYVKSKELRAGDFLEFIDGGDIVEVDFSKNKDGSNLKTVFQISVEVPGGKKKILTVNKASRDSLSSAWGTNADMWIGKKAEITFVKQLAFGKVEDVLVLVPID